MLTDGIPATENADTATYISIIQITTAHAHKIVFRAIFSTLLDLTDVCPLLTKQYTEVGLQIQYMLYNF